MSAVQHELCSRSRIVQAARCLFSSRGFHQTAMADLAAAADVSVGQIYRLYAGKADVILAIVREDSIAKVRDMTMVVDKVRAGTISIETAFTQVALRALSGGDEALSFEILAEAHRNPGVADSLADLCVDCRAIIRELACIANPALSGADLDGAEELVLAFMFGLGHRTLSRPRLPVAETARQGAHMILAALRGPGECESGEPSPPVQDPVISNA